VIPAVVRGRARGAGWALAAVVAVAMAIDGTWIARHHDVLRPLTPGDVAPEIALPEVGPGGALGPRLTLTSLRGHVVVLEMWATWCGPCKKSLPELASAVRRLGPKGLRVIAVDLDDAGKARALFDHAGYPMTLVFDDAGAAERYGVGTIPHAVVIDREGVVRGVFRADPAGALRLAEQLVAGG
jgi:cytochrome c biogenesis protein CcmG, thiol:disulfide interchange protein DsbE